MTQDEIRDEAESIRETIRCNNEVGAELQDELETLQRDVCTHPDKSTRRVLRDLTFDSHYCHDCKREWRETVEGYNASS